MIIVYKSGVWFKIKNFMKEMGLYYPDGSFKTDQKIKRDKALRGEPPEFREELYRKKDFEYWSERFKSRSQQYKETSPIKENHYHINLPNPSLICFIGDTHPGSPWVDYERLEQEVELIENTPNSVVIFGGDLIEGFFFNPAQMEQMEQGPEQVAYSKALIEKLGGKHKILAGWVGDHDAWSKKMGISMYDEFHEKAQAPLMHGVGHLTLQVGDADVKLTAAHRLPGHSMYNSAHPSARASREIQGADLYINFHTHAKGHLEQPVRTHGDKARIVHAISLGPYKSHDEYSRKHGWARQTTEHELYGAAVEIEEINGVAQITYHHDIVTAHRKFKHE